MPYGRCVIYSFTGEEQEVIEKSRVGVLPILKQQPGFIAYGVIVQNGKIFSRAPGTPKRTPKPRTTLPEGGSTRTWTPRSSPAWSVTTPGWSSQTAGPDSSVRRR